MENKLRSFLWKYYGFTFFYDLIFAYPIYAVFFKSNGLTVLQISLLIMWWSISVAVFEVPSGALADHWSRKNMLVISPIAKLGCFIIWYFADGSFWLYAAGFTLWGLSETFITGTMEAILYDSLKSIDKQSEYEKFRGRQRLFFRLACGIGCISGGFIAQYNMSLAVILSSIPLFIAFVVATSLKEPKVHSTRDGSHYFSHFKNVWIEIKRNPTLRYTFIYTLLAIGIFGNMDEYDPLYYSLVGLPIYTFGFLMFIRALLESAGGLFAYRLKNISSLEYLVPFITGLLIITVGYFQNKWMIIAILLSYLLIAPIEVLIDGKMQHTINVPSRATVTSAASLFTMICSLPLLAVFGWLSDKWGLGSGYIFFGSLLTAFSIWVFCNQRTSRTNTSKSLI